MYSLASILLMPHIGLQPLPFADFAALNFICVGVLVLCLAGTLALRANIATKWPLVAILTTLGGAAVTGGISIYFAHIAVSVLPTVKHPHPLEAIITYPSPYVTALKALYAGTAIIICATFMQVLTTFFRVVRRPRPKSPVIT